MADFVSEFWSWFIVVLTLGGIAGLFWLTWWMSGKTTQPGEAVQTMGHVWDENLAELNNPLPKWWLNLFYVSLLFGMLYLLLYPGLGSFGGILGWTQTGQYDKEIALADSRYGALYDEYLQRDIATIVNEPEAVKMGERLFVTYCTTCHGADARGVPGYPNLRDGEWLYGGQPQHIEASILNGRSGQMPGWQPALGPKGVDEVTEHVLQLAGRDHDAALAEAGEKHFATLCAACHGTDGRGNQALGAPNLTNDNWLYGGSREAISQSIANGRQGKMPAHQEFLGKAKVHLLATYVYSLSADRGPEG